MIFRSRNRVKLAPLDQRRYILLDFHAVSYTARYISVPLCHLLHCFDPFTYFVKKKKILNFGNTTYLYPLGNNFQNIHVSFRLWTSVTSVMKILRLKVMSTHKQPAQKQPAPQNQLGYATRLSILLHPVPFTILLGALLPCTWCCCVFFSVSLDIVSMELLCWIFTRH